MTRIKRCIKRRNTKRIYIYNDDHSKQHLGNDDNSNSLSYTVGQIDVFVNGVRQDSIMCQPMEHQSY